MPHFSYILEFNLWIIFLGTFLFFSLLYFVASFLGLFFSHFILPLVKLGKPIDLRPLTWKQQWKEITYSLVSIVVFGLLGVLTKLLIDYKIITVIWEVNWLLFPIEIILLFLWNELHFYIIHRLLHTKWLYRKVHVIHHRSIPPTPFSTYSFHYLEALMLGSVMIMAMLMYSFSFLALVLLPIMSILLNVMGHFNYDIFPNKSLEHILSFSRRHSLHHSDVNGNFGFLLPHFDQLLKTHIDSNIKGKL